MAGRSGVEKPAETHCEVPEQHPLRCMAQSILQTRQRYHRGRGRDCFAASVNSNLLERQA